MGYDTSWLDENTVSAVVDYWARATDEELERMFIPRKNLAAPEAMRASIISELARPDREKKFCYLLWNLDGRTVGYSSLKRIRFGDYGDMHLHVVDRSMRGRGHGPVFFSLSSLKFAERFQLKNIVCEPSASNPSPNSLLRKIGYRLNKSYVTASSELSREDMVNQYQIDPDVSRAYLAKLGLASNPRS